MGQPKPRRIRRFFRYVPANSEGTSKVCVFCRLGTTAHYTLIIAYSVVIALGFLGNIAIIVAFLANKVRQEYQAKKGQTMDMK